MASQENVKPKEFRLWKPSLWDYICKFILSESFAWGLQNALGVLFTILFAVVDEMTFTLACIVSALYGASSQVLSLDRSVGGRLFAGSIFLGCILSGGVAGFAVVSLSWLARGDNVEGVLEYLPSDLQQVPSRIEIAELKVAEGYLQKILTIPPAELNDFVQNYLQKLLPIPIQLPSVETVLQGVEDLITYVESLVTNVDTAYWVLLIILYFVLSFPFAFSRGLVKPSMGIVLAIATLFMASQVVFGALMPIFGQRLFWTQVTGGYFKVALVNIGAMIINGLLLFVQSSHDSVRRTLGNVLLNCGKLLTQLASDVNVDNGIESTHTLGKLVGNSSRSLASSLDVQSTKEAMLREVRAIASQPVKDDRVETHSLESGSARTIHNVGSTKMSMDIFADTLLVEDALAASAFEPPIPGVSSQWGARKDLYEEALLSTKALLSVINSLETSIAEANFEAKTLLKGELINCIICRTMASTAALASSAAETLQSMPLGKKCYGPSIKWKPRDADFWEEMRKDLSLASDAILEAALQDQDEGEDAESGLPLKVLKGRSTLLMLATCESLLAQMQDLENKLSVALAIRQPQKNDQTLSFKDKLMQNPYAPSCVMHTLLLSSLLVWALIIDGMKTLYDTVVGKPKRRRWSQSRDIHFGLKYWLGMTIAVMGIILIFWQGKGDDENPIEGYANMADFFFNWQPVYFSITAAICIQMEVETSAFRAVLRSTMTFLGGLFGYLTMLNGSLAQNPYFITCITCAFNCVCGFFSPIKRLRYSLFLTAFTYNAVVICQYFGCCDISGEAKNFGGKVVSTMLGSLFALLVSWCFLPYYTSEKMLDLEQQVLNRGTALSSTVFQKGLRIASQLGKEGGFGSSIPESNLPSQVHEWRQVIQKDMFQNISLVQKDLMTNTIDKRQGLLLTWLLLPTPQVVPLVLERLVKMSSYLLESSTFANFLLLQSPDQNVLDLLSEIENEVDSMLRCAEESAEKCSKAMMASSKSELFKARKEVQDSLYILLESRAKLRFKMSNWCSKVELEPTIPNLRFAASLHLLLLSVREVEIVSIILGEIEESIDRDHYFAWLSSWFGRRPIY